MRREYRLIIEQDNQGGPLHVRLVGTEDGHRGVLAESDPGTAIALKTAFRQVAEELAAYRDEHGQLP
jgi:hypothetical protein